MTQSIMQTLFFKNECVNNMMGIVEIARADMNAKGHGGTVMMTKFEEAVYAFALRYASGRKTYAHRLVIDEIIRHLKDFPCPESFLREVELRRGDALRGFVPWDIGEEAEFINLEIQIKAEIERRKVER